MAVTVGQTIGEAEYTTLRSGVVIVMGTPSGSTATDAAGYNQTLTSGGVNPGDKILATQWNELRSDIVKAFTHQTGNAPSSPALPTVDTDTGITAQIHNDFETVVNFIKDVNNRFDIGTGQSTLSSASSKTKTNWNGTQIHDVTFTWSSANEVKAYFNAGGDIRISSSLSYTGSEAKTLDWKDMITDAGTVIIDHASTVISGGTAGDNGVVTNNDGWYDLNTTEREVFIKSSDNTNVYAENDYRVLIRQITNGVRVRVMYQDDDTGDQTGSGAAQDENVKGTLTSALSYNQPTGGNVSVPAPTVAYGNTNTFT